MFVNLTGKHLLLDTFFGSTPLPPTEPTPVILSRRVNPHRVFGFPVSEMDHTVKDLPAMKAGVYLLVADEIRLALPNRKDLYSPAVQRVVDGIYHCQFLIGSGLATSVPPEAIDPHSSVTLGVRAASGCRFPHVKGTTVHWPFIARQALINVVAAWTPEGGWKVRSELSLTVTHLPGTDDILVSPSVRLPPDPSYTGDGTDRIIAAIAGQWLE